MKMKSWLIEWLDIYIKPTTKIRTFKRYSEIVWQHIIPRLGEFELGDVTPYIIQCYINYLLERGNLKTGKGLAANSIYSIISVIQSSFKMAFDLGYLKFYSLDKIKRPKSQEKVVSCFTLEEQKRIEKMILKSGKDKLFGIVICFYTGLRIGELLALKWEDLDFNNEILNVYTSCHDGKNDGGKYVRIKDTPKTPSSVRSIPLPKRLIPFIIDIKKRSLSEYVVSNKKKLISVRSNQGSFSLILKKLKIPHRGFHSIRHTFATRALECGVDIKTLSEILGHKTPTILLNRYAHSLFEHKKEMMNKVGNLF